MRSNLVRRFVLCSSFLALASLSQAANAITPDEVMRIVSQSGPVLGGRAQGARRIMLPNDIRLGGLRSEARSVVVTHRIFTSAFDRPSFDATLATTRDLSSKGIFAELLGEAHLSTRSGKGMVHMILEDMSLAPSGVPALVHGDADALGHPLLRTLSPTARRGLLNEMLARALLHPDGHAKNLMFRVLGTGAIDVRMVDPFPRLVGAREMRLWASAESFGTAFADLYTPTVQSELWSAKLGIAPSPPDEVLAHATRLAAAPSLPRMRVDAEHGSALPRNPITTGARPSRLAGLWRFIRRR